MYSPTSNYRGILHVTQCIRLEALIVLKTLAMLKKMRYNVNLRPLFCANYIRRFKRQSLWLHFCRVKQGRLVSINWQRTSILPNKHSHPSCLHLILVLETFPHSRRKINFQFYFVFRLDECYKNPTIKITTNTKGRT